MSKRESLIRNGTVQAIDCCNANMLGLDKESWFMLGIYYWGQPGCIVNRLNQDESETDWKQQRQIKAKKIDQQMALP